MLTVEQTCAFRRMIIDRKNMVAIHYMTQLTNLLRGTTGRLHWFCLRLLLSSRQDVLELCDDLRYRERNKRIDETHQTQMRT